jgi:hypothetical protein
MRRPWIRTLRASHKTPAGTGVARGRTPGAREFREELLDRLVSSDGLCKLARVYGEPRPFLRAAGLPLIARTAPRTEAHLLIGKYWGPVDRWAGFHEARIVDVTQFNGHAEGLLMAMTAAIRRGSSILC